MKYSRYIFVSVMVTVLFVSASTAAQGTSPWIEPLEEEFALSAARAVCYSALTGNVNHSIIMVPLPNNNADLDGMCHNSINPGWHAGGVAKGRYFSQDCGLELYNRAYGGGYTSYVTEEYFEANRGNYPSCGPTNAFICCSPSFPE